MALSEKSSNDQYLDLKKLTSIVLKNWYVYLISILGFILIAYVIGKVIVPTYEVSSSIYIKENTPFKNQQAAEFLNSFQLFDQKRTYQNEMLILQSTPLVLQTIDQLQLEVEYASTKGFISTELYKDSPFVVIYDSSHVQPIRQWFNIEFLEDGRFKLSIDANNISTIDYMSGKVFKEVGDIDFKGEYDQYQMLVHDFLKFKIYLKDASHLSMIKGKTFRFQFRDKNALANEIQRHLKVTPANPEVSVVEISLTNKSKPKAIDFVSTLMQIYLSKNLNRKNHFAQNTIAYINSQLDEISDSLYLAESRLEDFRSGNQVIDMSSKATRVLDRLQQLELDKATVERQYQYYQYIDEFFKENNDLADLVAPSSMGITDQTLNDLMRELSLLVNQRNELKKQKKSPYLKNIERQIESLKRPIVESIGFSLSALERTLADLEGKIGKAHKSLEALPKTERQLIGFERQFQLNNAIYTFLLQRRAEAQIAKASNLPEHEVVEPARLVQQVFPNPRINYTLAILLGLMVPSLFLMFIRFFDDRIKGEDYLEGYTDKVFLGAVTKKQQSHEDVMAKEPHSAIAETFRTIRTNLFYVTKQKDYRTILVTSSISGEGKSFVSLNLAIALANMDYKVVLLGFDLRKSNQFSNIVRNNEKGLTSYYIGNNDLDGVIQNTAYKGVDMIAPGAVPPNPMELVGSDTTKGIFTELRERYDYVIIDSSPVGVVSDAYLLMEYSDVNLFVVRENYSTRKIVDSVMADMSAKNIKNLALVLNASKMEDKKYRYDYYNKYNSGLAGLN